MGTYADDSTQFRQSKFFCRKRSSGQQGIQVTEGNLKHKHIQRWRGKVHWSVFRKLLRNGSINKEVYLSRPTENYLNIFRSLCVLKRLLVSTTNLIMPVRPSVCPNMTIAPPTQWIFVRTHICDFNENLSTNSDRLRSDATRFTQGPTYIYMSGIYDGQGMCSLWAQAET